jgi:preprotein translocase subunit YajC
MSDFDSSEFENLEEFEETPEGGEGQAPKVPTNRNFKLIMAIIGAIIVVILIAVGVYFFLIRPNQVSQTDIQKSTAVAINAANTATASVLTQQAVIAKATNDSLVLTLNAPPTNTPVATSTPLILMPTETLTPTVTGTPVPEGTQNVFNTQTAAALQTQAAEKLGTATATPTALPGTGFADEVGLPMMVGMAILLLVVMVMARRLRMANR